MSNELSAAIQSMKIIYDIVVANKDLTNYNELVSAVSEVNTKLMSATAVALASQKEQALLTERIRELEKKIMEFENWEREIQKYEPHVFETGTHAFALKKDMQITQPLHYICASCAGKRQISIMQPDGFHNGESNYLRCPICNLVIPTSIMSNALENSIRMKMKR